MWARRWGVCAAALVAILAGVSWGALDAMQKAGAEALIKQLSSPEFKVREAAVEKLVALGPDVAEFVKPLLASPDAELKMRAEMILKRVGEAGALPAANEFDRVKGSLVTLKLTNADLATVLRKIAEQTGTKEIALPEQWDGGKPVTVDFDKTPYWVAMDKICEPEGLVYYAQWNAGGLKLSKVDEPQALGTSYAGPVVFKVTSMLRNRVYWGRPDSGSLGYEVMVMWQDDLAPAWGEDFVVEKATDEHGRKLNAIVFSMASRGMFGRHHALGAGLSGAVTFTMNFTGVPAEMNKLGELSGKITMGFAKGVEKMVVDDPLGKGERTAKAAKWEIKALEATRNRDSVSVMTLIAQEGKPARRVWFEGQDYGIWLVDEAGKKYAGEIGSEGAVWSWAGNPKGQDKWKDHPLPAGTREVMFHGVPEEAEIVKVIYAVPAETSREEYKFKFDGLTAQ